MSALTVPAVAVAILLAAFVKGAIAFGFPTIATPLLALVVDVKTAVGITILPNIVMDVIQVARRRGFVATIRRWAVLLAFGMVGTVAGTRLLVVMPARRATLVLGCFVLLFVVLNSARFTLRVPATWERWLGPPVGLVAGLLGGITNVPGLPIVIFFYALGMDKHEFVRTVAFAFIVYKVIQLGAVTYYGLLTWPLVGMSVALTVVGLGAFALGLRLQDRLDQAMFHRVVRGFLTVLGAWLIVRSL